ncbi:MAG: hypothetical protein JNJ59_15825 [Deltaproteobacteria bacterium]|nr:hypothetical protein [Deltaproteobacteria bacterium]
MRPSLRRTNSLARSLTPLLVAVAAMGAGACGSDANTGNVDEDGDTIAGDTDAVLPDSNTEDTLVLVDSTEDVDTNPADTTPCPGCTGAPCDDNSDCNSGYCLEGPDGKECVRTCDSSCPTGYACRGVQNAGGDPVFVCLYDHVTYCQPCRVDGDCETGIGGLTGAKCLPVDDAHPEVGRFCRTRCTPGSCPNGATCEEIAVGGTNATYCRPGSPNERTDCQCSARSVALSLQTACNVTNAAGTCGGSRTCVSVGAAGLSACDAKTPIAELCNAQDDDCDGTTDEDVVGLGEPCDGNDSDKCKNGISICAEGGGVTCLESGDAKVELCNDLDDDCDGATDNGFDVGTLCDGPDDPDLCPDGHKVCSADGLGTVCQDDAAGPIELCNGVDDDCDTTVDEGFEQKLQPCDGDDPDQCKDGVLVCSVDGLSLVCNDDGASRVEICNELDDDCSGSPDDTFPDKLKPCDGTDSDLCKDGVWVCSPDGTGLVCTDDGLAKVELCNDLDDDCDGQTDEDFPTKGTACDGADADLCKDGTWVCGNNTIVCNDDASAVAEVCDGQDNDCDGLTDGTDPDLERRLNPVQLGACAGTYQRCAGAGGYVADYSSVAGYGLAETPDASYLDENCDGLDGTETKAVFVVPGAGNSGTCTKASPCGSPTYAITQTTAARNHVYIQAGTYTEVVEVPSGKNIEIYGGYNSAWVRKARSEVGHAVVLRGAKQASDGEYMAVRVRSATVKIADLTIQGVSPGSTERNAGRGLSSYAVHAVSSTVTLERVEVQQGNGASGADGTAGTDAPSTSAPAKAGKGGNATQGVDTCDNSSRGGGAGGQSNGQCSAGTQGGNGGTGGTMDTSCGCAFGVCVCTTCAATSGTSGTSGSGSNAGGGGSAGSGGSSCSGVGVGGPGQTPSHGAGGGGGGRGGALTSNFWYGTAGATGSIGNHGSGGGGGGGSGGCDNNGGVPLQNSSGAGGGGGGAGGCRAQSGGTGGGPGGSSFGLFAVGGTVTVRDCRFALGNGGSGGIGGAGGRGQPGGDGGDGGNAAGTSQAGGSGGRGGDGGASGGGGGGAGGSSVGVYTQGSAVTVNAATVFTGGAAGAAGAGGSAQAAAGANGPGKIGGAGRLETTWTCASAGACGD